MTKAEALKDTAAMETEVPTKVKILIVDDHSMVREGVKMYLGFDNTLEVIGEAVEADHVLAHHGLDREHGRLPCRWQRLKRSGGTVHHVADAVHVDDDPVGSVAVDGALELADHGDSAGSRRCL